MSCFRRDDLAKRETNNASCRRRRIGNDKTGDYDMKSCNSVYVNSLWYRIISAAAPRMAPRQPFERQPAPFQGPVFAQRFDGILRAGRRKTARRRRKGRDAELIELHHDDQRQRRDAFTSAPQSGEESGAAHVRRFYRGRSPSRSRPALHPRRPAYRCRQAALC